jgi:hypothetical protein
MLHLPVLIFTTSVETAKKQLDFFPFRDKVSFINNKYLLKM